MTLGEAKKTTFALVNIQSNAITKPDLHLLFNTAQKTIAQIARILKTVDIVNTADTSGADYVYHALPTDFFTFSRVTLNGNLTTFVITGDNKVGLPADISGTFTLEYYAYPSEITATTLDTYNFELRKDAQNAIPYYVAAQLALTFDTDRYAPMMSQYQAILTNLDYSRHLRPRLRNKFM